MATAVAAAAVVMAAGDFAPAAAAIEDVVEQFERAGLGGHTEHTGGQHRSKQGLH
jgi:hypothetical protein